MRFDSAPEARTPFMIDALLQNGHYAGIIILLILTGAGLPIPEEVIVIFAGIASRTGVLNPWLAFASCLIGALVGDFVTYAIGRHFGRNIVREHHWFTRYVTPEREQKIEDMIHRRGPLVFFFARFMVGLRSPVYLTAGIMNVPLRRFIIVDTICATSVIGLFFGLSFVFAAQMQDWWVRIRQGEVAITVILVAAIVTIVGVLYIRHRRRVRAEAAEAIAQSKGEHLADSPVDAMSNGAATKHRSVPVHSDGRHESRD
ncbi:MAG TPA: DedA family protein [Pirellulales bacterium]|jgi:membrane protein DedA with SNARE-associated domain|nr:DedA family protein [Pirellulales bacterium]